MTVHTYGDYVAHSDIMPEHELRDLLGQQSKGLEHLLWKAKYVFNEPHRFWLDCKLDQYKDGYVSYWKATEGGE